MHICVSPACTAALSHLLVSGCTSVAFFICVVYIIEYLSESPWKHSCQKCGNIWNFVLIIR